MHYIYLALAIIFEVVGSSFIKVSDGFTKILPTVITAVAYLICFFFLSLSLRGFSLGTAYAIWAGAGIVLTTLVSVFIFKQSIDIPAISGIVLIVAGVLVINFLSKTATH